MYFSLVYMDSFSSSLVKPWQELLISCCCSTSSDDGCMSLRLKLVYTPCRWLDLNQLRYNHPKRAFRVSSDVCSHISGGCKMDHLLRCISYSGWCSTPFLIMSSSLSRENGHILLICTSDNPELKLVSTWYHPCMAYLPTSKTIKINDPFSSVNIQSSHEWYGRIYRWYSCVYQIPRDFYTANDLKLKATWVIPQYI